MTDDPLATARAWIEQKRLERIPCPRSHVAFICADCAAAALAAAVRAKGEADAELLRSWAARAPFVVKAAVDLHKELMMAHAADIPPPPRTP